MKTAASLAILSLVGACSWAWTWHVAGYLAVLGLGILIGYVLNFALREWPRG